MENSTIKLQTFRKNGSRMFSGREFGLEVREKIDLDNKDKDDKCYEIIVSDDTIAINSSFFGGLFSESVYVLGVDRFREKYIFKNEFDKPLKPTIQKDIEEGIYDTVNG